MFVVGRYGGLLTTRGAHSAIATMRFALAIVTAGCAINQRMMRAGARTISTPSRSSRLYSTMPGGASAAACRTSVSASECWSTPFVAARAPPRPARRLRSTRTAPPMRCPHPHCSRVPARHPALPRSRQKGVVRMVASSCRPVLARSSFGQVLGALRALFPRAVWLVSTECRLRLC
jgi:hypothetical protein